MGLLQTLRSGVKIADKVTKPLQSIVTYRRYTGQNGFGEKTYSPSLSSPAISLRAVVEDKQEQVRTFSGELSQAKTSVLFLDVNSLITATSGQGIKEDDLIILQNGDTGPILNTSGFIDGGTGIPIATQVYLG
jgi:hypothetical protein